MRGGTSAALQRWLQFKVHGLHLYAARRNDALQREGVSRLSAYHHYGMVSPFQVAREAKFSGGATGVKFLDEFLVWREIAYHFCFHRWAHAIWFRGASRRHLSQRAAVGLVQTWSAYLAVVTHTLAASSCCAAGI
jgi:deoxyribodipyrimidine photolyase